MKLKKQLIYLTGLMMFVSLCSLSRCFKEDKIPGPETIVQGRIVDIKNNVGVGNIRLDIIKNYRFFLSGPQFTDQDSIFTNSDGTFYKKFTPEGTGDYTLQPYYKIGNYQQIYTGGHDTIKLGTTTTINFAFMRTLKLTVHITNNSSQNRKYFNFVIDSLPNRYGVNAYIRFQLQYIVKDTTISLKIPQLSGILFTSTFHNGYPATGSNLMDTLTFKRKVFLNRNDTTINIVNP